MVGWAPGVVGQVVEWQSAPQCALAALASTVHRRRAVDGDQSGKGGKEHEQGFHGGPPLVPSNRFEALSGY